MGARGRAFWEDRGIGMTELAVAILVLGIVLIGLIPLIVNSIGLAERTSEAGQANRIVSSQLERARTEFRSVTCESVETVPGAPLDLTPELSSEDQSSFSADWVVTCDGPLATVTVNVQRAVDAEHNASTATTKVVTAG